VLSKNKNLVLINPRPQIGGRFAIDYEFVIPYPSSPMLPTQPSLQFYDLHPTLEDFQTEVLRGLQQPDKVLSPKFLYDKRGAELFDAICQLQEYYLTRAEMAILRTYGAEIAEVIGEGALIEFGSGSSQKIRILLDAAPQLETYVALDISKQHLQESCLALMAQYPRLQAIAICTDYTQPISLSPIPALQTQRKLAFFPGSSIGNLEPEDAITFLRQTAAMVETHGGLLVGVDLKKSRAILEPAYDDAQGISAAFALNGLVHLNRELGANFNLDQFAYRSFYNPIGRIEMYLVSLTEQVVEIGDRAIPFAAGERLRTEYSYKYDIDEFQALAMQAGFQPRSVWTDPQALFSLHYLAVDPNYDPAPRRDSIAD
jgi:dimethylhistidine N-methyltransferase